MYVFHNTIKGNYNTCTYFMSYPLSIAVPLELVRSPVNILKVVVFPAPLTPSRPKHSPAGMIKFTPFTASFLPSH